MKARRTKARLAIAVELLTSTSDVEWGYDLSRRAKVGAGSMYPFLAELLEAGHLKDGWEDPQLGRPPRRYYELTESGRRYLRDFVQASPSSGREPTAARSRLSRPAIES